MSFNQDSFSPISAHATDSPRVFSYRTEDSLSEVLADDYFFAKRFQLDVGDAVIVSISNRTTILNITQSSPSLITSEEFVAPATGEVLVKSLADLPDPVLKDGVLTIIPEEKQYKQNNDISSPYPLATPLAGKRCTWTSLNRAVWTYTGEDSCFRDKDAEGFFETQGLVQFEAPNGNIWDFDSVTSEYDWSFQASDVPRFGNCKSLGTVKGTFGGGAFNIHFGSIVDFDQGLIFEDLFFFEINQVFVFGNNQVGCVHFTGQGNGMSGSVNFITPTVSIGSNETVFDMKPEIQAGIDSLNFRGCQEEGGLNGSAFAAGSLTQKDLKVVSSANSFFPDSKRIGSSHIKSNAVATDPTVSGQWYDIDFGVGGLTVSSNIERFTLTNAQNGEKRYDDSIEFNGEIIASFTAVSTGGARVFKFRYVKDTGSGFEPLEDDVEIALEIGATVTTVTLIAPSALQEGDLIKPQVTRVDGTSTITVQNFSDNIS